jgi:hypothetical protein
VWRVVGHAGEHDHVQCSVEVAVTAAVDAVRTVWPEEAGMGAEPASDANEASERKRPWWEWE